MATISDIAKKAGVTTGTVSNILNERYTPSLPKAVKRAEKIRRIAAELGYRPNSAARAMRRGRYGAVGLIKSGTHPSSGGLSAATADGIEEQAEKLDLRLVIGRLGDEELTDSGAMPKLLQEWTVDGVLVSYTHDAPHEFESLLDSLNAPAVWINTKRNHDCVQPDDYGIAAQATRELLKRGHRRIAYLGHRSGEHYSTADRAAGFEATVSQAGGQAIFCPEASKNCQAAVDLLSSDDRPTGIVLVRQGMGVIMAAMQIGLSIPKDLSIVAVRDYRYAGGVGADLPDDYHLHSIVLPTIEMGRESMLMLESKIKTPTRQLPAKVLPGKLHEGNTCGPA